jgi:hypothetical protein
VDELPSTLSNNYSLALIQQDGNKEQPYRKYKCHRCGCNDVHDIQWFHAHYLIDQDLLSEGGDEHHP